MYVSLVCDSNIACSLAYLIISQSSETFSISFAQCNVKSAQWYTFRVMLSVNLPPPPPPPHSQSTV